MSKPNAFDVIRERHQTMARLIASGRSTAEVARLTGTSAAALDRQISDPAFRDLVSRYRLASDAPNGLARFRAYALAA